MNFWRVWSGVAGFLDAITHAYFSHALPERTT